MPEQRYKSSAALLELGHVGEQVGEYVVAAVVGREVQDRASDAPHPHQRNASHLPVAEAQQHLQNTHPGNTAHDKPPAQAPWQHK